MGPTNLSLNVKSIIHQILKGFEPKHGLKYTRNCFPTIGFTAPSQILEVKQINSSYDNIRTTIKHHNFLCSIEA